MTGIETRKAGLVVDFFILLDGDLDCIYSHGDHRRLDKRESIDMIQAVSQRLSNLTYYVTTPIKLVLHEHKWALIVPSMCVPQNLFIVVLSGDMDEGEEATMWRILGRIDYLWYFFHGSSNNTFHKPFANFLMDLILFVSILFIVPQEINPLSFYRDEVE